MTDAIIGISGGLLVSGVIITWIVLGTEFESPWPWTWLPAWRERRANRKYIEEGLERRDYVERVQALEHELGMLPHADPEYLCQTCRRDEERAALIEQEVADSWKTWRPGGPRRTRIGRNLYPDNPVEGQVYVNVTGFGSVQAEYVDGGWVPSPPFPNAPPEVTKK